jgi:UDP-N-acetylglucosamine--N-acetylmuramyl-(pentapeptide) pyrophosphoryl-undecaprenol N-acetylglucosamine transferase
MKKQEVKTKILISGGGTGGHIYPAIAIANELMKRDENIDILFIGAKGRMEMEMVPAAGYEIIGLPVRGLYRNITLRNIIVLFKLLYSLIKAGNIISKYKPDLAVGTGGYASSPALKAAAGKGIPTIIQEQNSYAGITNRILGKKARIICVAYEGMEKYFQKEKIILTGNPVRKDLMRIETKTDEALRYFNISGKRRVLLILGGSLGAYTINKSVFKNLELLGEADIDVIWQTGSLYFDSMKEKLEKSNVNNVKINDFITRMDLAYSIADLIISRAGACTISELCIAGKPLILVPSPNVAENHQTKNAMFLADKNAAIIIKDSSAKNELIPKAIQLIADKKTSKTLAENCKKLGIENSAERIVDEIYKLLK